MKLSDHKGAEALEMLGDLIEYITDIMTDDDFVKLARSGGEPLKIVQYLLQHHAKNIMAIMARIDGEDPETYQPGILELPKKVLELVNDPDVADLFTSWQKTTREASSASALASIAGLKQ